MNEWALYSLLHAPTRSLSLMSERNRMGAIFSGCTQQTGMGGWARRQHEVRTNFVKKLSACVRVGKGKTNERADGEKSERGCERVGECVDEGVPK